MAGTIIVNSARTDASNVFTIKTATGDNMLQVGVGGLAASTITTAMLADNSVTAAKIAPGTIVDSDIADNAVTTAKILNANVTEAKLAANAVTTSKVGDNTVTTAKIANDAVTVAKVNLISTASVPSLEAKGTSGVTSGYIQLNCSENSHGIKLLGPPHSAAADYTLTLPNNDGNANQFLQTNGSGVTSWATPSGGGVTLLGTLTTTSGTTQSFTVDHTAYNQLMFVFEQVELTGTSGIIQVGVAGLARLNINDVNTTSTTCIIGPVVFDLNANVYWEENQVAAAVITSGNQFHGGSFQGMGQYQVDQNLRASASAAVSFSYSSGASFDGGKIHIYGVK